jgi:membrane glycosyltransferase
LAISDPHPAATAGAALTAYLEQLEPDAQRRAALQQSATQTAEDARSRFAGLHHALTQDDAEGSDTDAVRRSAAARLRTFLRSAPRKGDPSLDRYIVTDRQGEVRLVSTPPLQRASMSPVPWNNNPLKRLWRWLRTRTVGARGQMRARAAAAEAGRPVQAAPWKLSGRIRRGLLVLLILAQSYVATYFMSAILPYHGQHPLEIAILIIYAVLFAWISAGFWTALLGFFVLMRGRDRYAISASAAADQTIAATARTAILVPICNEDVVRVFAGVRATWDSICRQGLREHFDLFILSDSYNSDTRVAEIDAWLDLCRDVDGFGRIFYRRRTHRIKRKSGNIADWCRRWGSAYRYMVILDADSVMSGDCLKRLVQLMEANPGAGIIQTAPRAAGRETLYSRIQQFATRVYGPLFTAGLHCWQLGESHYWGHNAIIRVAPFMEHCALGRLPGRGALSGEIMSHDFVEAALMRRAGWGVWIAYDLPGSYEEMPPTLLDELKRDQRWCQGNLQNFRLFFAQGLHPAHRAVFMTGVMAYLSAPLWFLFLLLSTALIAVFAVGEPQYFTEPNQLFPNWPSWHPEWAIRLFGGTMTLLLLPKLLAMLLIVLKPAQWRGYGGVLKLALSTALEMLFSAALAPIRMLFHTRYVLSALAGFSVKWQSPPREDAQTLWRDALRRHGGGTVLGLCWLGAIYWLNPDFLWWLLPVAGSLVLAIPLSVWSSRVKLGRGTREARLFLIPEESIPPRELRWLRAGLRRAGAAPAFHSAVGDPVINALLCLSEHHRTRLSTAARTQRNWTVDESARLAPGEIDEVTRNRLLSDPHSMARFHLRAWTDALADPGWRAR